MLNRRILRIKVFQTLYAYHRDENPVTVRYETFLENSLRKIEDTYLFVLNLPVEIRHYIENVANPSEIKYFPSQREIETGSTFIYNSVTSRLSEDEEFQRRLKHVKLSWYGHEDVFRHIFNTFKGGEWFQKYLDDYRVKDFSDQKRLMLYFFREFLPNSEDFDQLMEELNLHWQDDKKLVFNFLVKSVEQIEEADNKSFIFNLTEDWSEDWSFARDLFRKTILNEKYFEQLISRKTEKWDTDRIAKSDLLLMKMALCEMLEFPSIPLKVTINEYLEVAKLYSTPKSNAFLNGILDKLMFELKAENKIVKQGRGLVE